jgi:hypothetical protein
MNIDEVSGHASADDVEIEDTSVLPSIVIVIIIIITQLVSRLKSVI